MMDWHRINKMHSVVDPLPSLDAAVQRKSQEQAMTDFTPCPKTIRLCIEALPEWVGHVNFDGTSCEIYRGSPHKVLEEMLPDPAEELLREYAKAPLEDYDGINRAVESFVQWIVKNPDAYNRAINQGKVRP